MNIRMSTKGKRPMRSLTPSDKIHAIQRIHDGESKASVARDIGVPESTLRGWCKNEDKLRFMSRQSAADKMSTDVLSEKLECASGLLGGPPEKRQKVDSSLPLNFSNKMKYDEMGFKRSPLSGLDFSVNKGVADLNFNGLALDYANLNGSTKNKGYGADITRQNDPSVAAISPLSSLSHLSGLTGLSHSPLAISFNELTSNLNLLAQLNPGFAAMSGLNGLASATNQLRSIKPKATAQIHSPRSEGNDRQQGLTVKTWAKQKNSISSVNEFNFALSSSQSDPKSKIKCPSPSLAPSLGNNLPISAMPDDPLLYWLKSQQAMLGLNSLYPPPPPPPPPPAGTSSPPIRSSTPQQIPLSSTPLTPSSTPSGSLDDKNTAWFNWCKAFGASLTSLAPSSISGVHPIIQPPTSASPDCTITKINQKPPYENILYSHLTKDTGSPSIHSSSSAENMHNEILNNDSTGKPEDLSAKSSYTPSSPPSPLPTPAQSPDVNLHSPSVMQSREPSPILNTDGPLDSELTSNEGAVADCKDVLDNLLFKINSNNPNISLNSTTTPVSNEEASNSDASYEDTSHNNNDLSSNNNNNNNSNKTDEEEKVKSAQLLTLGSTSEDLEAIQHGEKFLQWLENCSNPRVTAVQLMQLRFLISAIKTSNVCDQKISAKDNESQQSNTTITETATLSIIDDTTEDGNRLKLRRRK